MAIVREEGIRVPRPDFADAQARPEPNDVRRVAVVGGGLIGSRWTALFLANGLASIFHERSRERRCRPMPAPSPPDVRP